MPPIVFVKDVKFAGASAASTFNRATSELWGVNGRLSGFVPTPVGGGTGTPGISQTGAVLYFSVNLSPGADDETVLSPTASAAVANGVTTAIFGINLVTQTLTDDLNNMAANPYVIFVRFDNSDSAPIFGVARQTALDANPEGVAKLAFFDATLTSWQLEPQVSVRGLLRQLQELLSLNGGFATFILENTVLEVSPGALTNSFDRMLLPGTRLVDITNFPAAGMFRRDLLVAVDPNDESVEPQLLIIKGSSEFVTAAEAFRPPPPQNPTQVPLASMLLDGTLVKAVSLVDLRPILAWQTDAASISNPIFTGQLQDNTPQPGFVMTDPSATLTTGSWFAGVFTDLAAATLPTKYVIGLVGVEIQQSFLPVTLPFPPPAQVYTPTDADFPPAPYVLKSSFKVLSTYGATVVDVTNDPAYAISFDFLNGKFLTGGITRNVPGETFTVIYKQVAAFFVINTDGTNSNRDHDLLIAHLSPTNPAAHTSSNITYDNAAGPIPGLLGATPSAQVAIAKLAALVTPASSSTTSALALRLSGDASITLPGGPAKLNISDDAGEVSPGQEFSVTEIGAAIGIFVVAPLTSIGTTATVHIVANPTNLAVIDTDPDMFTVTVPMGTAPGSGATFQHGHTLLALPNPITVAAATWLYAWLELPGNNSGSTVNVRVNLQLYGTVIV